MVIFASLIGYLVENAFKLFKSGYIDNRYMFLPFLLGYGLFTVALGLLLGTPKNLLPLCRKRVKFSTPLCFLVYFAVAVLLVSVGELILGFTVEKIGGFIYWDYSDIPLHFTRYTSLPTSLGFGLIIMLFMGFVYEPSMTFFETKMNSQGFNAASVVLLALLLMDFVVSFGVMKSGGERMLLWRLYIFK